VGGLCSPRARDPASVRPDLQVVPVVRARSADGLMSALPSWALASGQGPCPRGHFFFERSTSVADQRCRPDPCRGLKGRGSILGTCPRAGRLGVTTAAPDGYRHGSEYRCPASRQPVDCSRVGAETAGRQRPVIAEACPFRTAVFSARMRTASKWLQVDRGNLPILSGKAEG
jgi:hypothetical protein